MLKKAAKVLAIARMRAGPKPSRSRIRLEPSTKKLEWSFRAYRCFSASSSAVFNRPFFDLDGFDRVVHLGSLLLVAVSIGLIMAPAAYHRLAETGRVSGRWVRVASRYIACAMVALMLAIGIDIYIVTMMIVGSPSISVALGALTAGLLGWLWFGIPLLRRSAEAGD